MEYRPVEWIGDDGKRYARLSDGKMVRAETVLVIVQVQGGTVVNIDATRDIDALVMDYDTDGRTDEIRTDNNGDKYIGCHWDEISDWEMVYSTFENDKKEYKRILFEEVAVR